MLYFDHDRENVRQVKKLGVVSVLIAQGMTHDLCLKGIQEYSKKNQN